MSDQTRASDTAPLSLPETPNLDWLRKQARRCLNELRKTNPDARLAEAKKRLDVVMPELVEAQKKWEADVAASTVVLAELQKDSKASAADKKNVFVVRADGTVAGGPKGLFNGGALESAMQPGDMIVVPSKALGGGFKWRETLEVAQLVSAIGIAVQVARGF